MVESGPLTLVMVLDTSDAEADPVSLGVELGRVFGVPAAEGLLNLMLSEEGRVSDKGIEGDLGVLSTLSTLLSSDSDPIRERS